MKIIVLIVLMASGNVFAKRSNKIKATKMYQDIKNDFKGVPELKLADLNDEVILIDVRKTAERKVSMIPGAISQEEFERNKGRYKGKKIAVYCTIGYRSAKYVKKLKRSGIKAYNLEGSILGWVHEGKPVVDGSGKKVMNVHVYGSSWNYLPEGYKGEW